MFHFPRAARKTQWQGQGDLINALIPYYGGDSLGVCFGISAIWAYNGAPFDCVGLVRGAVAQISAVQAQLHQSVDAGTQLLHAMDDALNRIALLWKPRDEREFPKGIASHVILSILTDAAPMHYVAAFYYVNAAGARAGHAIGVSFTAAEAGMIMDPNYGVAEYASRSALCSDFKDLLVDYCGPGGHLDSSYLLEFAPGNAAAPPVPVAAAAAVPALVPAPVPAAVPQAAPPADDEFGEFVSAPQEWVADWSVFGGSGQNR